ncbi:MAG: metal ABC transporter permease [Nitrospinota bacterium]
MNWLIEPFQFAFMRTALLAAALVAVTCATLGVYVVLRRMAFVGDAIAHAALPGLVVAYLRGWNLFGGALAAGLLTALGIGWLARRETVREDTAIGILFTAMFALGILLMSAARSFRDLAHMLFGNILAVTSMDLTLIAVVACIVLGALTTFHKELVLTSVDPSHAEVIGLNPDRIRYLLLVLVALTVVVGVQAVGVVLTAALLVTPAASAALLTQRLLPMMTIASAVAILSSVGGLYASFYLNVSTGPGIVLACTVCFGLAWAARAARERARSRE